MRLRTSLAVVLAALVLAPAAGATATPEAPANGATVTTVTPTVQWVLSNGEQFQLFELSSSAATNSDGSFVTTEPVGTPTSSTATSYVAGPLFAGHYYWHVETASADFTTDYWAATESFTVPVMLSVGKAAVHRYPAIGDALITFPWKADMAKVALTIKVYHGRTLVYHVQRSEQVFDPSQGESEQGSINRPHGVRSGAALRLLVTISAGGQSASSTTTFRSP